MRDSGETGDFLAALEAVPLSVRGGCMPIVDCASPPPFSPHHDLTFHGNDDANPNSSTV